MTKMTATEFRAECLNLLDEVERTGEPVIITKHGKPVARLVPIDLDESVFGSIPVTIKGDILSPILDWDFGDGSKVG